MDKVSGHPDFILGISIEGQNVPCYVSILSHNFKKRCWTTWLSSNISVFVTHEQLFNQKSASILHSRLDLSRLCAYRRAVKLTISSGCLPRELKMDCPPSLPGSVCVSAFCWFSPRALLITTVLPNLFNSTSTLDVLIVLDSSVTLKCFYKTSSRLETHLRFSHQSPCSSCST